MDSKTLAKVASDLGKPQSELTDKDLEAWVNPKPPSPKKKGK